MWSNSDPLLAGRLIDYEWLGISLISLGSEVGWLEQDRCVCPPRHQLGLMIFDTDNLGPKGLAIFWEIPGLAICSMLILK